MKIGRNKRTAVAVLGLLTAGLFTTGLWTETAFAQDAGNLLKDAVELKRRGKDAEANDKARAALAANPSSDEAYDIVRTTDVHVFLDLLKGGGDMEKAAARILRLSHQEEIERSQDAAAMRALVNRAVAPGQSNLPDRMEAARELAAKHGEYAVPMLVEYLGTNDTHQRANAIMALRRIGGDAVSALAASLTTGNQTQKDNVASLLQAMGDHRSEAAQARHAGDAGAAKAYMKLAKAYFGGDPQTLRNYDGTYAVWGAADGKLAKQDVPRFLYQYELAEQACYDALAVDAKMADARAMIALVSFAEIAAFENLADEAQQVESIQGAGKALEGARGLAASVGAGDLLRAMQLGMELGANGAVAHIAAALPGVWDGRKLDAGNALVEGLGNDDKVVRYASAMALAAIDPADGFPKSKEVGAVLGAAASETAVKQVLVIDTDSKNAMNVQRQLNKSGFHAVAATTGTGGLMMAKGANAFDAVVIRNRLADITSFQVIDELARDFRTQNIKVVIMATGGKDGAGADFAKREIAGYAPAGEDLVGTAKAVSAALEGAGGDGPAGRANAQSIAASNAIAGAGSAALGLGGAEAGLLQACGKGSADEVRLAALGALANVASGKAQGTLSAIVGRTENSGAIRAAACTALGRSVRGAAPARETFAALMGAMGDADMSVRTAAGGALGSAKLTDEQRQEVLSKQRVN